MAEPSRCAQPQPAVTISVCPSGWVCHAVRSPGSKVTLAPTARAGSGASNKGSIRTVPVNQSVGPFPEGRVPTRLISIVLLLAINSQVGQCSQNLQKDGMGNFGNAHSSYSAQFPGCFEMVISCGFF